MTAADLAARDLGHTVSVHGFRGVLTRIEQAADPRYIELRIDAFRCWVKPEQACTVEES